MNPPDRMTVGSADAIRCALGLLLPAWFYVVGLMTGVAGALGSWSPGVNTAAAVVGFAFAAGVEVLRRIVLWRRPAGGRSATAALRTVVAGLPVLAVLSVGVLITDLTSGCFSRGCGEDGQIAIWLWLALCLLCLLTTPVLFHLLRRSPWLQPRLT